MTTKHTHGPCTCWPARASSESGHLPDCPSLYPAQKEPDALTKLVRRLRQDLPGTDDAARLLDSALALISEAREEQRKALVMATNEGLEKAAGYFDADADSATTYAGQGTTERAREGWAEHADVLRSQAREIRALKDPKP